MYSIYIYNSLLINVSVSLIVSEVLLHMTHVPFTHTCTTKYHQNMIYLVGLPSVLYERPGQNERSVLNQLFLLFFQVLFNAFHVLFLKSAPLFIQKVPLFIKTNKTMSICVYTCAIYTYMYHIHHQISPKYKIYLVGTLQNTRSK